LKPIVKPTALKSNKGNRIHKMKRLSTIFSLFLLSIYIFLSGCTAKTTLVTGSYSESGDKGINVYGFNPSDGSLELKGSANAGVNP
jgi:hypothetical protein